MRSSDLTPEETGVLRTLGSRLARARIELVTVLLGTATHEVEEPQRPEEVTGPCWILEDDSRGRGVRLPENRPIRVLSAEELAEELMAAEKVISLP